MQANLRSIKKISWVMQGVWICYAFGNETGPDRSVSLPLNEVYVELLAYVMSISVGMELVIEAQWIIPLSVVIVPCSINHAYFSAVCGL